MKLKSVSQIVQCNKIVSQVVQGFAETPALSGIKVFNLVDRSPMDTSWMKDQTVKTVICYNKSTFLGQADSTTIIKKRFDNQVRDYVNPNTFDSEQRMTDIVDVSFNYRGRTTYSEVVVPID